MVVRVVVLGSDACKPFHIVPPDCGLFPRSTKAAEVKASTMGIFPEKRLHELTGADIGYVCTLSLYFVQNRKPMRAHRLAAKGPPLALEAVPQEVAKCTHKMMGECLALRESMSVAIALNPTSRIAVDGLAVPAKFFKNMTLSSRKPSKCFSP